MRNTWLSYISQWPDNAVQKTKTILFNRNSTLFMKKKNSRELLRVMAFLTFEKNLSGRYFWNVKWTRVKSCTQILKIYDDIDRIRGSRRRREEDGSPVLRLKPDAVFLFLLIYPALISVRVFSCPTSAVNCWLADVRLYTAPSLFTLCQS